jgi:hypothetical protein
MPTKKKAAPAKKGATARKKSPAKKVARRPTKPKPPTTRQLALSSLDHPAVKGKNDLLLSGMTFAKADPGRTCLKFEQKPVKDAQGNIEIQTVCVLWSDEG